MNVDVANKTIGGQCHAIRRFQDVKVDVTDKTIGAGLSLAQPRTFSLRENNSAHNF